MKRKQTKASLIRQSPKMPAKTRREQLLQSAHDLFVLKGYHATTTEEIARRAGLTKGAFYHHFKSKEEILGELVRVVLDAYQKCVQEIHEKDLSPDGLFQKIRQIDQEMPMHEARNNPGLMTEIMQLPRIQKLVNEGFNMNLEYLSSCLDRQYGKSKAFRRQMVIMTLALYDGLKLASCFHYEAIDMEKQEKMFSSLFTKGKGKSPRRDS